MKYSVVGEANHLCPRLRQSDRPIGAEHHVAETVTGRDQPVLQQRAGLVA